MDVTGVIKVIGDTHQVSGTFKKREFVLTDNSSQYPQHISFQLTQDKVNLIDQYTIGSELKVHFNLRGREWTSPQGEIKYFNTIEAWRIEGTPSAGATTSSNKMENASESFTAAAEGDDLPF